MIKLLLLCAIGFTLACRTTAPHMTPDLAPDISPDFAPDHARLPALKHLDHLRGFAATQRYSSGTPKSIKITPEGDAVLFLRSEPRDVEQSLYEFDPATGVERVVLTAQSILRGEDEELSADELARRERRRISARGITDFHLSDDGRRILLTLSGDIFVVDRVTGDVTELSSGAGYPIDARFSPDGAKVACVRDGDLYVTDVATNSEMRLTTGAADAMSHGLSEFVAQEEMGRMEGYWWSPDAQRILYQRTDTSAVESFHIADPIHPEKAPTVWPYPRPGKANADVRLALMNANGSGDPTEVEWDREAYPYLARVEWTTKAPLTILVQNRRQTEVRLLVVDPETGATTTILTENDPAWVNLDDSTPKWLPDGSGLLWMSERTGSRSLELHDPNGAFTRRLTPDGFTFGNVVYIAPDGESLIITGSDNPTENHVFDVDLNGGEMAQLTQDSGHHGYVVAKNGGLRVHSYATRDAESGYEVLNARGDKIGALRSVAEKPAVKPNVEFTTVGEPDYHAVVIRPRDFNPRERYPVIVYVYGGPHHLVVRADPYAYIRQQWIADQGFIVVTLDNRGTPGRGRTWERSVKGDLIKLPLEDQIAGLNALAKKYPELDTSRVGIYGWSFGGYFAANAVMRATQVYHAAVAGAPVADWRDYDTHYTERYMGLPEENPEGYDAASALTHARTLRRPLMLIHGTADDNVYFLHSLKISSELYAAGIPHDFLPLTNFTHMVPDPDITIRQYERIVRFFQSHLCDRMTQ